MLSRWCTPATARFRVPGRAMVTASQPPFDTEKFVSQLSRDGFTDDQCDSVLEVVTEVIQLAYVLGRNFDTNKFVVPSKRGRITCHCRSSHGYTIDDITHPGQCRQALCTGLILRS